MSVSFPIRRDATLRSLAGSGFAVPFNFSEQSGGVRGVGQAEGLEEINALITSVLTIVPGEIFGHPAFGSNLRVMLMDPMDPTFGDRCRVETAGALARWVPQITLLRVSVVAGEEDPNQASIHGEYAIRNTPIRGSFVHPLNPGTSTLS